jgi:transposase-like protein
LRRWRHGRPADRLWLLERRRRAEAALVTVVATSYLLGVSTGLHVTTSEDGAGWLGFFRDLAARGLSGVALVTSDA